MNSAVLEEKPPTPRAFSVRQYGEGVGDFQMVSEWLEGHDESKRFTEISLPPVGIVVEQDGEPIAACWMYLAAGIGVAFLEWPVTRPGLGLGQAKAALGAALGALELIAKEHDYGLLIATTRKPVARALQRFYGFSEPIEQVQVIKQID